MSVSGRKHFETTILTFCLSCQEEDFTITNPQKESNASPTKVTMIGTGPCHTSVQFGLATITLGTEHTSTNETHSRTSTVIDVRVGTGKLYDRVDEIRIVSRKRNQLVDIMWLGDEFEGNLGGRFILNHRVRGQQVNSWMTDPVKDKLT